MRVMSIEIEYVTFLILLLLTIILFCTVAWFVARRKYKDYVKNTTVEDIQKSIEILNQITKDEIEELTRSIKLEAEISSLKTKIYFLSKYNCLNVKCNNRKLDQELIDDAKDLINETDKEEESVAEDQPQNE
jgi:fumarate reductase subunit C